MYPKAMKSYLLTMLSVVLAGCISIDAQTPSMTVSVKETALPTGTSAMPTTDELTTAPEIATTPNSLPQCANGRLIYRLEANLDDPRNGLYVTCMDGSEEAQFIQGKTSPVTPSINSGLLAYTVATVQTNTLNIDTHLELFDIPRRTSKTRLDVVITYSLSWSPDGQYIAFIGEVNGQSNRLGIINIGTGTTSDITFQPGEGMMTVAWSPVGDHLLYSTIGLQDLKIFEVDVQCDATTHLCSKTDEIQIKPSKPVGPTEPVWSPDGKSIAAFCGYPTEHKITLCIMDGDGKISKEYTFTERMMNSMRSPAWSPDGQRIAFSADTEDGTRTIFFVSLDDGSLSHLPVADNARKEAPVWLP